MSVKRDLRQLLASSGGTPPDDDTAVMDQLLDTWFTGILDLEKDRVRSSTAPFFASDGAGCARKTAYDYLDRTLTEESLVPASPGKSNPPGIADHWTFRLGNLAHDEIQRGAPTVGYENEVRAVLTDEDGNDLVSTRIDLVKVADNTAVELKSKNGYGFKMLATTFRGDPEGPSFGHIVQTALSVRALRQQGTPIARAVLIYLALEKLSPSMAKDFAGNERKRFAAQFTYTIEELDEVADRVLSWLGRIKTVLDEGTMPPRVFLDPDVPPTAVVVDPRNGGWQVKATLADGTEDITRSGSTWMCNYCDWQDQCLADLEEETGGTPG